MHELIPLRLWTFTMIAMLGLAISVPGQTPPCDASSQARAALALAQTPPPTGSAQNAPPAKNDYSFNVKKKTAPKCDCGCDKGNECTCDSCIAMVHPMTYAEAYPKALEEPRHPLLVWVGQPIAEQEYVPGVIECVEKTFPGAKAPCLVVSRVEDGVLIRVADMPGTPNADQIRRVLAGERQTANASAGIHPNVQRRGGTTGC